MSNIMIKPLNDHRAAEILLVEDNLDDVFLREKRVTPCVCPCAREYASR